MTEKQQKKNNRRHEANGKLICCRLLSAVCRLFSVCIFFSLFIVSTDCFGQTNRANRYTETIAPYYTYVPRKLSKEGDYKVVVVPAINPRQARLDAQTYHIGWDAIDARPGQSSVMYDVLLKKRAPYVPGTPPVTRRIPK